MCQVWKTTFVVEVKVGTGCKGESGRRRETDGQTVRAWNGTGR